MLHFINGYWKDNGDTFEDFLVSDAEDAEYGLDDDEIFFYGFDRNSLETAVAIGEATELDFVVTSFRPADPVLSE